MPQVKAYWRCLLKPVDLLKRAVYLLHLWVSFNPNLAGQARSSNGILNALSLFPWQCFSIAVLQSRCLLVQLFGDGTISVTRRSISHEMTTRATWYVVYYNSRNWLNLKMVKLMQFWAKIVRISYQELHPKLWKPLTGLKNQWISGIQLHFSRNLILR